LKIKAEQFVIGLELDTSM